MSYRYSERSYRDRERRKGDSERDVSRGDKEENSSYQKEGTGEATSEPGFRRPRRKGSNHPSATRQWQNH